MPYDLMMMNHMMMYFYMFPFHYYDVTFRPFGTMGYPGSYQITGTYAPPIDWNNHYVSLWDLFRRFLYKILDQKSRKKCSFEELFSVFEIADTYKRDCKAEFFYNDEWHIIEFLYDYGWYSIDGHTYKNMDIFIKKLPIYLKDFHMSNICELYFPNKFYYLKKFLSK